MFIAQEPPLGFVQKSNETEWEENGSPRGKEWAIVNSKQPKNDAAGPREPGMQKSVHLPTPLSSLPLYLHNSRP